MGKCNTAKQLLQLPSDAYSRWIDVARRDGDYINITMNGERLTKSDAERVVNSLALLTLMQYDIVSSSPCSHSFSTKSFYLYLNRIVRFDISELLDQLSNFKNFLQHYSSLQRHLSVRSARSYMKELGVVITHPVFDLIRPILYQYLRKSIHGLHVGQDDGLFKSLYDFSCFISRLTLKDVSSVLDANVQKYIDQEEEMKTWSYDSSVVDELRSVCQNRLQDWSLVTDVYPDMHHSNGATSECKRGVGIQKKYERMFIPSEFVHLIDRFAGLSMKDIPCVKVCPQHELSSSIQFVPKGIDKKRVISMEPTGNVFIQNAIFHSFDVLFTKHPEWGIDLHDQEKSRELVFSAAQSHCAGTIDLSAASDSITLTLIESLLKGTPLYEVMASCRTIGGYLPTMDNIHSQEYVLYEKYMPMGTPVTFPLQCFIFSSICQLAKERLGLDSNDVIIRVYGDDIIADERIYDEVELILRQLNFTVNVEKSFRPCEFFKESCGAESFFGFDVSPCRISRRYDICKTTSGCHNSAVHSSLVEMRNIVYAHGYRTCSMYLAKLVLDNYPLTPFVDNIDQFGLLCQVPKNGHLTNYCRYNYDLQRFEVKSYVTSLEQERHCNNEIRYYETLRSKRSRNTDVSTNSSFFSFLTRKGKWKNQSRIYTGNTRRVKHRIAYSADIIVKMDRPIPNVPLVPPAYWKQ